MSDEEIRIEKVRGYVPISLEMLADHDPEAAKAMGYEPPPPPPWRRRIRWEIADWWWRHRPRLHFGPCEEWDK